MNRLKPTNSKRNIGADVIRCLAFFSVVSVHFIGRIGFSENVVEGEKMFLLTFLRAFFIICVPLFMMLSGYLMLNKKAELNYYKKIGKTYLTYALASLCCIVYSAIFLNSQWSLKRIIFYILGFKAAPYAWYVEMYLGLFLIIPFLNILYNNIPEKKWKKLLILIMIAITSLPSVVNVYNLDTFDWLKQPSTMGAFTPLIPAWWTKLYPITYYFIGCYLREYGLKLKKLPNFILIILAVAVSGGYSYWRSYKTLFIWGDWNNYHSLFCIIITTLVFTFFININYEKVPGFIAKLFKTVSGLCFGAYLVSWMFDDFIYTKFNSTVPVITDRIVYFFIITVIIYVCSLITSYVISKIQLLLEFLFTIILKLFRKNKKQSS